MQLFISHFSIHHLLLSAKLIQQNVDTNSHAKRLYLGVNHIGSQYQTQVRRPGRPMGCLGSK